MSGAVRVVAVCQGEIAKHGPVRGNLQRCRIFLMSSQVLNCRSVHMTQQVQISPSKAV